MTMLAWLIGLVLPACASAGAAGLPPATLLDFDHLERPSSPNTALAAPAGFTPAPDIVTPVYSVTPEGLYSAISAVASTQPRTFLAADFVAERQVHWVARSAAFNFPDLVTAQVAASGTGASTLVLFSRSVYGRSDFGMNRQRITAWLAALQTQLNQPVER